MISHFTVRIKIRIERCLYFVIICRLKKGKREGKEYGELYANLLYQRLSTLNVINISFVFSFISFSSLNNIIFYICNENLYSVFIFVKLDSCKIVIFVAYEMVSRDRTIFMFPACNCIFLQYLHT